MMSSFCSCLTTLPICQSTASSVVVISSASNL